MTTKAVPTRDGLFCLPLASTHPSARFSLGSPDATGLQWSQESPRATPMAEDNWHLILRATIPIASERKNTLYFCAGLRHLWDWVYDHRSRKAVEVAELFVDGLATVEELGDAAYFAEIPGWGYGNGREPEHRVTEHGNKIRYEEDHDDFSDSLVKELLDSGLLPARVLRQGRQVSNVETLRRLQRIGQIALFTTSGNFDERWPTMLADVAAVPNWPGVWLIREIHGDGTPRPPDQPRVAGVGFRNRPGHCRGNLRGARVWPPAHSGGCP